MDSLAGSKPLALKASGIKKAYKEVVAVKDLSLEVRTGECLALLGPNGAGKTTTVEMLVGLVTPDSGDVAVKGQSMKNHRRELMERVGVLLQETQLYKRYTVRETLVMFASFFTKPVAPDTIIARMQLEDKANTQLRKLSGGQRQRVYIGCALINDPDLIFLDEPTTGLDPQARRAIWDLLGDVKKDGRSIVLTTHYMEEAERLADRVAIMDHGQIIALGTPKELIAAHASGASLKMALTGDTARVAWTQEKGVVRGEDGMFEGHIKDVARDVPRLIADVERAGCAIAALEIHHATLEDVFIELTGRRMRDG